MADKAKVTTKVNSFEDVQRSLQEVEKSINQISDSVNVKAEGQVGDIKGKTGDIRTTQNSDKTFTFEVRTSGGWKAPYLGDSSIKFKDKESSFSQNQKKSIDELEVEDTSKGTTKAKHIAYDEKADKFILPRPDFDSGWYTWDLTEHNASADLPLKIAHPLNVLPTLIIGYYAPNQATDSVTWFTQIKNGRGYSYDNGIGVYVDKDRCYFYGGQVNSLVGASGPPSLTSTIGTDVFDDGSVKVLLWK
tara:strand:+ start:240 stop:980 length:741 start_codon:yes stop_codon:yes gene_type:complete